MFNTEFNINSRNNRIMYRNKIRRRRIGCILILIIICIFAACVSNHKNNENVKKHISDEVIKYRPLVERYAEEYGILEYTDYLLAIMQVESGGREEDVMQSSESLGLKPNTLNKEQSIQQGCKYFSELIKLAEDKKCDIKSVIQSYNYGKGFLDYVEKEGYEYTFELAENFAEENSKDTKVEYKNPIAIKINGGWRYKYGNMFYVNLINQYVDIN